MTSYIVLGILKTIIAPTDSFSYKVVVNIAVHMVLQLQLLIITKSLSKLDVMS